MGLLHDVEPTEARVRIVGSGALSMPEMIAAVDRVAGDPRFRSTYAVVFDLRAATYTAELNDGEAFVAALKRRMDDFQGRFALVVPEALFFLGKLYSVLASVGGFDRMRCFRQVEEAEAWCRQA
jgi:hypothetical protein